MTNEEFAKLFSDKVCRSKIYVRLEDDILNIMRKHNLVVMKSPEARNETMTDETTLEEKLAKEAWRLYSSAPNTYTTKTAIIQAFKNLNLKVIPAPKNPHKHFDLAVEAYGDTTIEWQVKSCKGTYSDLKVRPLFDSGSEYRKKPKRLKFRNYKFICSDGAPRIGFVYAGFAPSAQSFEWVGDWQEVQV